MGGRTRPRAGGRGGGTRPRAGGRVGGWDQA